VIDGEKPGVDSRDEGKHTGSKDLLFVEKMRNLKTMTETLKISH